MTRQFSQERGLFIQTSTSSEENTHTDLALQSVEECAHTHTHTRGTEQEMMSPTQPGEMRSAQKRIKTNLNAPI